jgi:hypothetical protein
VFTSVQFDRFNEIEARVRATRSTRAHYRNMSAIEQDRDDLYDLLLLAMNDPAWPAPELVPQPRSYDSTASGRRRG